jgi:hypothetical protein
VRAAFWNPAPLSAQAAELGDPIAVHRLADTDHVTSTGITQLLGISRRYWHGDDDPTGWTLQNLSALATLTGRPGPLDATPNHLRHDPAAYPCRPSDYRIELATYPGIVLLARLLSPPAGEPSPRRTPKPSAFLHSNDPPSPLFVPQATQC